MRQLEVIKTENGKSSDAWKIKKSVLRVTKNWILSWIAQRMPGKSNQFFFRAMGIKIGKKVQLMPGIRMEIFFPELLEINNGVVIGQETFIACHEFNVSEFRYGKIIIGKNALIGARCFLLPGIKIGENSMISANTTVYTDIPENVLAFGSPLQFKKLKK
jgi:acetyltransferase-like isoleucine patch superfamily enzyme